MWNKFVKSSEQTLLKYLEEFGDRKVSRSNVLMVSIPGYAFGSFTNNNSFLFLI